MPHSHFNLGAVAQLEERVVRNDEVVGSIPISSTKILSGLRKRDLSERLLIREPSFSVGNPPEDERAWLFAKQESGTLHPTPRLPPDQQ